MMMAQKPLHELLKEDQEPFLLKNYIADRRCQFKKLQSRTQHHLLQIKKRKPIPQNFCKNACFFSVINSPDLKKSPLFELQSPVKSPRKTTNAIFLDIPAKTAGLLLDAALRIQKQSSACQKPKNNNGFGLFGSLLNRLKKTSTKKEQLSRTSVKDVLKFRDSRKRNKEEEMSSGVWSESNCNEENNSWDFDLETSSSGQLSQEMEFVSNESPFHFVLKRSSPSSSGHRTPVFLSPATSPCRHKTEVKENNNEVESLEKFQENNDEEEDKEQCSPVSVLDPPFEDDDDGHYDLSEDDGFDLECSYAFVQRAKLQLLQKLRRFEKLAGLDPVELEKRMLEQEHELEEEPDYGDDNDDGNNDETDLSDGEQDTDTLVIEELMSKSSFCRLQKIPKDMKRLVSDLINEEEREQNYFGERETTAKRVCKRFESWKEVESNTIDMMVEEDFKKELDAWRKYQEQVSKAALEIELGILELLVEELSQELVSLA